MEEPDGFFFFPFFFKYFLLLTTNRGGSRGCPCSVTTLKPRGVKLIRAFSPLWYGEGVGGGGAGGI